MPRRRFIFDPPERFVAGTIGEPGDRTFFLQARDGVRVVSVALEKVQVSVLAERLGELLDELDRRGVEEHRTRATACRRPPGRRGAARRAAQRGVPGRLADPRLGRRRGAGPGRGAGAGRGRRADRSRRGRRRGRGRAGPAAGAPDRRRGALVRGARRPGRGLRPAAVPAVRGAARPDRPHLPAPQRPLRQLGDRGMLDPATTLAVLRDGDIEVVGRIVESSNNALLVRVTRACPDPEPPTVIDAIYKPTIGERPLDDFPDGTLTRREVAAWHVSEATGWGIVPPTILRDGPFGEGMVQAFIEADPDVDVVAMVLEDDPRLRRMAALDAAMNNTDRKGGHILPGRRRAARPRRRPRRVLLDGAQAADRAVGLARDAVRGRRARRPGAGPDGARRRARRPSCGGCSRPASCAPRGGGSRRSSRRAASRSPPRTGRPSPGRRSSGRPSRDYGRGHGQDRRIPVGFGGPVRRDGCGSNDRQPAARVALTTIVLAKTSWKPCLVGLFQVE